MNGPAMASADTVLAMMCFWVMNCAAVMARIITIERSHTATTLPPPGVPCSTEADSGAPKMLDSSNCTTCSWLMAPMPVPLLAAVVIPDSTVKSAKKNGTWISRGRHAENGLVPCFL